MQILFNGLCNGAIIALLAMAFSIVYLPTGILYLALAGIYVISAYITMQFLNWGFPWFTAVSIAIFAGILISVLCDLLNHRPLENKGSSSSAHMISSLGIFMILIQFIALIWGSEPQVLKVGITPTIRWNGLIIAQSQLAALGCSLFTIVFFFLWLKLGKTGLLFRGLAENPVQMALTGYNTDNLRLAAFGISGGIGAFAGILNGYDLGFDPHIGMSAILLAIVATIIGGKNHFAGPIVGGLILGIIRSMVVWYASARWQDAITFLLLAGFLFLCPNGILGIGQKERMEVQA